MTSLIQNTTDVEQKELILCILQECFDKLLVANKGQSNPDYKYVQKKPMSERFKESAHASLYYELDPFRKSDMELNEIKRQNDKFLIHRAIRVTLDEIRAEKPIKYIPELLKAVEAEEEEISCLHKTHEDLNKELNVLVKQMSKKMTNSEIKLHFANDTIQSLKNDLSHQKQVNQIELDLIKKWENARVDQVKASIELNENKVRKTARMIDMEIEIEQMCMEDIENYTELNIREYQEKIEYWTKRYSDEMNYFEAEIFETEDNIRIVRTKRENIEKLYEERGKFIVEYYEQIAKEQKELKIQKRRICSAIKIQAWWRGTMVRKGFGSYRKKKKGKKGKKGK